MRRTQLRAAGGGAPVDDHALGDAGRLVGFSRIETPSTRSSKHLAVDLGDDRAGVGIPLGEALAALDLVARRPTRSARRRCTLVRGALLAVGIDDEHDLHVAAMTISIAVGRSHTLRLRMRPCLRSSTSRNDCSATCAAPPMWKVRMVSWVPGSPIDCAAMTPTASPMLTGVPRARSRP
jgi:hypothetical protein